MRWSRLSTLAWRNLHIPVGAVAVYADVMMPVLHFHPWGVLALYIIVATLTGGVGVGCLATGISLYTAALLGTRFPALPLETAAVMAGATFLLWHEYTRGQATQAAVVEARQHEQQLLAAWPAAVIGINAHGIITRWNARAVSLFGYSAEDAVGAELADLLIPVRHQAAHRVGIKHALTTGEGPIEMRWLSMPARCKDNSERRVNMMLVRADDPATATANGRDVAWVAFISDPDSPVTTID